MKHRIMLLLVAAIGGLWFIPGFAQEAPEPTAGSSTFTITGSRFEGNTATQDGGGLFVGRDTTITQASS